MTKLFWLTSFLGFICLRSPAQQANDSATDRTVRANSSLTAFSDFSFIIKDFDKVLLQWSIDSASRNDYFVIERGKDTLHFEPLGIIRRSSGSIHYEMTDNSAFSGFNYYRLKSTDSAGGFICSRVLQVGVSGKTDFRFYPNPADKFLIIESVHPVSLQVLSALGSVLVNRELPAGVQIINVSGLEKGDYIIRFVDKATNRAGLEHLLKN